MILNKHHITLIKTLSIITLLLLLVFFLHKCSYSYYKIGQMGECGEITILKDYVIFEHYSSLCIPQSNYVRVPIEYDSHILEIVVTTDSMIHIVPYSKILSYELSAFKGIDTAICSEIQMSREHTIMYKCILSTYGYGLYPTFYYPLSDSTILYQEYEQRFPFESPDNWCYYDTITIPQNQYNSPPNPCH